MMEHPAPNSMEAFSKRALPPADMLSLSLHLANCATCRQELEAISFDKKTSLSSVEWYPIGDIALHLSGDEIATAAADQGTLEADAASHLTGCAQCLSEVEGLRRFYPPLVVMQPRLVPIRKRVVHWPVWAGAAAAAIILTLTAIHLRPANPSTQADLAHAPELIASLHDGGVDIGLNANGELDNAHALPPEYTSLLVQAFATHHLPTPPVSPYDDGRKESARGDDAERLGFRVLSPLSERTSTTPEFHWRALPNAESYRVEVSDQNYKLVSQSPTLKGTSWLIPTPLEPGKRYTWIVRAKTARVMVQSPRPPAAEAHFQVADRDSLLAIATVAKQFPQSHLLLASLYARAGLKRLAAKEMSEVERQNPGSTLARDLGASLEDQSR